MLNQKGNDLECSECGRVYDLVAGMKPEKASDPCPSDDCPSHETIGTYYKSKGRTWAAVATSAASIK